MIKYHFRNLRDKQKWLLDIGRSDGQWHSSSFFKIAIVHDEPGQFGRPSCALKTNPQNLIKFNLMNLNFSLITGSGERADPDVVAPHFHVVNLVGILGVVRMKDESARLSLN